MYMSDDLTQKQRNLTPQIGCTVYSLGNQNPHNGKQIEELRAGFFAEYPTFMNRSSNFGGTALDIFHQ